MSRISKYKKALPVKAGFRKFLPVPPNISLPITNPNDIPIAACQRGISGGQLKEKRTVDTNAPSFISCFRTIAKSVSQAIPTINTTIYIGRK